MRNSAYLLVFGAVAFGQPPSFTLTDVGALPNSGCTPTAISANGAITGFCTPFPTSPLDQFYAGGSTSGFLYRNGTLSNLGATTNPVVLPFAVNDAGVVVGVAASFNFVDFISERPITNSNGSLQPIAGAPNDLIPLAISNSGVVAGTRISGINIFGMPVNAQAVKFSDGQVTTLPPAGTLQQAGAIGMSPNGMVAGFSSDSTFNMVTPTLWQSTTAKALPVPAGFITAIATSVTDTGQAAGSAFRGNPASGQSNAFWYDGTKSVDLGTLPGNVGSAALGINSSGWIVGFVNPHSGGLDPITTFGIGQKAVLWVQGTIYNLASLVTNATGWNMIYATAINNNGQIVGTGLINGAQHVFLLTPSGPSIDKVVGGGLSVPAVTRLSPNGIFSVFGTGFAPPGTLRLLGNSDIVNNTVPAKLGSICVQAGGQNAGILGYTATQVNAVFTAPVTTGNISVSVITNCATNNQVATPSFTVQAAAATPEFLFFVQNKDGVNPVAAVEAVDNSYVGPPGLIPGATFAPAHPGDIITIYVVGLGATDPPIVPGMLALQAANVTGATVTVGNVAARVFYAGVSPTYSGLYQLNIEVPDVSAGNQPVSVSVGNATSPPGAYLAVVQ